MSDVETLAAKVREEIWNLDPRERTAGRKQSAFAALDRLAAALAAEIERATENGRLAQTHWDALERAEQERDALQEWTDRVSAESARAATAAEKAELALAEIARLSPFVSPEDDGSIMKAPAIARSALRASEDQPSLARDPEWPTQEC